MFAHAANISVQLWERDENDPKFLGRRSVTTDEAIAALKELAEPWPVGSFTRDAIKRAARRADLSPSRATDIWYGKARRIEDFESDALTAALDKKRREVARNELHEIKKRVAILEARLAQTDSEFHRETIDALGIAAGSWRRPSARSR